MPFESLLPRVFNHVSVVRNAPTQSGVYGLSNQHEWIYIGETANIRDALLHALADGNSAMMNAHPTGFVFEVCDESSRSGRQDQLVVEYRPSGNRSVLESSRVPGRRSTR